MGWGEEQSEEGGMGESLGGKEDKQEAGLGREAVDPKHTGLCRIPPLPSPLSSPWLSTVLHQQNGWP